MRLFLAAYSFPPKVSGGTFRVVKFVKYLPEFFGGEIHVITAPADREPGDPSLERDVAGRCVVHRVAPRGDPRKWKRRMDLRVREASGAGRWTLALARGGYRPFYGAYLGLKDLLVFPDGKLFWSRAAMAYLERVLEPGPEDVLLTTCPERSLLVAASRLKSRRPHLRWVVDFRDGWYGDPFNFHTRNPLRIVGERAQERRVFRLADAVVCATDLISSVYQRRYPDVANRLHTIFNGFDPEDFEGVDPVRLPGTGFHLVYTGYAGGTRTTYTLLAGIRCLARSDPGLVDRLHVHFVGGFRDDPERWRNVLGDRVHFHGQVSHREAVRHMLAADALLVLIQREEGGPTAYTGKIFEYVRAGPPILVLAPPCGATRLVDEWRLGASADGEDPEAIRDALKELVVRWRTGTLRRPVPTALLDRFDRREGARQLAGILSPPESGTNGGGESG